MPTGTGPPGTAYPWPRAAPHQELLHFLKLIYDAVFRLLICDCYARTREMNSGYGCRATLVPPALHPARALWISLVDTLSI